MRDNLVKDFTAATQDYSNYLTISYMVPGGCGEPDHSVPSPFCIWNSENPFNASCPSDTNVAFQTCPNCPLGSSFKWPAYGKCEEMTEIAGPASNFKFKLTVKMPFCMEELTVQEGYREAVGRAAGTHPSNVDIISITESRDLHPCACISEVETRIRASSSQGLDKIVSTLGTRGAIGSKLGKYLHLCSVTGDFLVSGAPCLCWQRFAV